MRIVELDWNGSAKVRVGQDIGLDGYQKVGETVEDSEELRTV